MKKILLLVCTGAFFFFSAFAAAFGIDDVVSALRKGSATELARHMDDNVEISLPSKGDSYSRSQASVILQDFFGNNTVRTFDEKFRGENNGSHYCVGMLSTRSGNYRTTVLMANRNGKQVIREIRFQNM